MSTSAHMPTLYKGRHNVVCLEQDGRNFYFDCEDFERKGWIRAFQGAAPPRLALMLSPHATLARSRSVTSETPFAAPRAPTRVSLPSSTETT